MAQAGQTSEAAERYAGAAFELAEESKALEAVEKDLATFAEAMAASADLRTAASSPLIAPEEKSRALVAVAAKLGLSRLGMNLIGVAAANGRAAELPGIAAVFRRKMAEKRDQKEVEIISAVALDAKQVEAISAAIAKAIGQAVQPTASVDPHLIGGFIVRAGSRQFDSSVRTKLDNLKLALRAQ
ncbi:MAG TPA: ATP synthase F1 subunit delta [Caulobacterales bacterium]|nr:ATP synthase F1 subunit delta [Caulobacterales bacterium]